MYSSLKAVDDGRTHITINDVAEATRTLVEKPHTLVSTYNKAIRSPQKHNIYTQVLLACVLARKDELGYFAASAVSKPLSILMKKKYDIPSYSRHLAHFCEAKRGPILQKMGDPRRLRYRFVDPMMQPFVIIHGYATGLLNADMLKQVSEN